MNRLRLAVIGVGHLGKEHARILSTLAEAELVGVVDPVREQAEAVARNCNTRAFASAEELIGRIDAACVVVPTVHHLTASEPLLRRGIPLLVEKPLAPNLAEAERLASLAHDAGTFVQVGHIERFNPAFEELAAQPMRPSLVRCERVGPFTGRSADVGVVLDLMIHDLDLVLALVKAPATSVDATGVSVFGRHEDVASARLRFANGCIAELLASRASPTAARTLRLWGPDGQADLDLGQRKATFVSLSDDVRRNGLDPAKLAPADRARIREELFTRHLPARTVDGKAKDQLTAELQDFLHAVRTGASPRVTAEAGRDAIALAERILAAMKSPRRDESHKPGGPHRHPSVPGLVFPTDDRQAA